MNITTRAQDFEMTTSIDQYVRAQVRRTLHRFSEDILAVDVFMKDTNGPKGGLDKQALIRVRLHNRQVIALKTVHENLYAAVKRVTKQTRRAVRRQLQKSHRIDKKHKRGHLHDIDIAAALSN